MPHTVEVDQCRKIEQSGPTALAFSDGITHAIVVPSRVEVEAFRLLQRRGKSNEVAQLLLFSACLYLLLKDHLGQLQKIIIDKEYEGHEQNIRSFLVEYIKREGGSFDPGSIVFALIGRGSRADRKARAVHQGRDTDYRTITLRELLEVVK